MSREIVIYGVKETKDWGYGIVSRILSRETFLCSATSLRILLKVPISKTCGWEWRDVDGQAFQFVE